MLVTYLWKIKAHFSLGYVTYEEFNQRCALSSAIWSLPFPKKGGSVGVCNFKSPLSVGMRRIRN